MWWVTVGKLTRLMRLEQRHLQKHSRQQKAAQALTGINKHGQENKLHCTERERAFRQRKNRTSILEILINGKTRYKCTLRCDGTDPDETRPISIQDPMVLRFGVELLRIIWYTRSHCSRTLDRVHALNVRCSA